MECEVNLLCFLIVATVIFVRFNSVEMIRFRGKEYNSYNSFVSTVKDLSVVPAIKWIPIDGDKNRSPLQCPIRCKEPERKDPADPEGCCLCFSVPSWRYPTDQTNPLKLEYIRRNGDSKLLWDENVLEDSHLRLIHKYGYMSSLPINVCSFPYLVKIIVKYNNIADIGNITCLSVLDTLDVSHNKIKYITNTTFIGLTNLRTLDASYNGMTQLDPMTINGPTLQIFRADFSHNALPTLELSNFISEKDFCNREFSNNKIQNFVNTNGFKLELDKHYNGGMVSLLGNQFSSWIDFESLGVTDLRVLGKLMSYGFDVMDAKWNCDCNIEPILELAESVLNTTWRDYFNLKCWNPEHLRNQIIPNLVKEGRLDLFICNKSAAQKCPRKCGCFSQPSQRRCVVNCSNSDMKELPSYIPDCKHKTTLLLKNNSINHFEAKGYLKNISKIDVSNNNINILLPETVNAFSSHVVVNLENNSIQGIPRDIQTISPCNIHFGEIHLKCGCDDYWMKDYVGNTIHLCNNNSMYMCETKSGLILAELLQKSDVCLVVYNIVPIVVLSTVCSIVVGLSSFLYFFRYEIFLLKRRYFGGKKSKVYAIEKYDAFISFNDSSGPLISWVSNVLAKNLEVMGYRLYIPCRDLVPGTVREETLIKRINISRNYIVVLCDYYRTVDYPWTEIEWRYIWHTFVSHISRKIIVINFDHLKSSEKREPTLKAFLRLGFDLDFSNRKHSLIDDIRVQLGAPIASSNICISNRKTTFCQHNLISTQDNLDIFSLKV